MRSCLIYAEEEGSWINSDKDTVKPFAFKYAEGAKF